MNVRQTKLVNNKLKIAIIIFLNNSGKFFLIEKKLHQKNSCTFFIVINIHDFIYHFT